MTCETNSSIFLYWTVSAPHLDTNRERIVGDNSPILSPEFKIGFAQFNITRISENPLISQLMISNVTTEINGSTIYCSEDGNENGAPMITIDVVHEGIKHYTDKLIIMLLIHR